MFAVIITRAEGATPMAVGPYRNRDIADGLASLCNDRFEHESPGCAASVVPMLPSITSTTVVLAEAS